MSSGTSRRVWVAWAAVVSLLATSLVLWIVKGLVRGVPGPIINGVYVTEPIDAVIVFAYALLGLAMATVAALLIARVPGNTIGWILGSVALWQAITFLVIVSLFFFHEPGETEATLANWLGDWTFVPPVGISLVLMIFPDGRLPSHRWWPMPWLAVIGILSWMILEATDESMAAGGLLSNPYPNPTLNAVADITSVALAAALGGTIASLVLRYRRSTTDVRVQLKWVAFAGILQIIGWLGIWAWSLFQPETFGSVAVALGTLPVIAIPVALAVAIVRYRLYDIDRLISRAVSYTLLTALLAGGYAGGVLAIQSLLPSSGSFAVAGTTLAVAAVFVPLRRLLHHLMDRRFNRQHFDAERVVESFSVHMGTIRETDRLIPDLIEVLRQTIAPASIGIWIRGDISQPEGAGPVAQHLGSR